MDVNINYSYISDTVSKIRWVVPGNIEKCTEFVTGSWGQITNSFKYWKLIENEYSENNTQYIPKCVGDLSIEGDVSGLEAINYSTFAVSSSEGFVSLIQVKPEIEVGSVAEISRTGSVHKFGMTVKAPCTGISIYEQSMATVGEDGRLNILSTHNLDILRSFDNIDSCSLTAVSYINHKEIFVGNRMGVLKAFDFYSDTKLPTMTLKITSKNDDVPNYISSIIYHPTQKHIILVSTEEGSISVWDLRNAICPASYLSAHSSSITEMSFHRSQATKLFTSSENGELWRWDENVSTFSLDTENINPWLNGERAKNRISVTALISGINKAINSFDTIGSQVICGGDNKSVYYIDNFY